MLNTKEALKQYQKSAQSDYQTKNEASLIAMGGIATAAQKYKARSQTKKSVYLDLLIQM